MGVVSEKRFPPPSDYPSPFLLGDATMRNIIFVVFAIFLAFGISSAGWEQTYDFGDGDYAEKIIPAIDGGYIVAGYTYSYSADGYPDILVMKIDEAGEIVWTQTNAIDEGQWLNSIVALDSGYIAVGYQSVPAGGGEDFYIVKLDENGNILWSRTYALGDYQEANDVIKLSSSGNIIVVGYTETENHDAWVLCLNNDGDTLWTKTFGGDEWDDAIALTQSIENPDEFYLVGYYGISTYDEDLWIVKMNIFGDTLWTKTYGGSSYDEGYGITAIDDGYAIAGATSSFGAEGKDAWMVRINSDGDTIGSITYGAGNIDISCDALTISPEKVAFVGYTTDSISQNLFVLAVSDTDGSEMWSRIYGSDSTTDAGVSICSTNDGAGMIIAGNTSAAWFGSNDIYLLRTDTLGLTDIREHIGNKPKNISMNAYPNPFNSSCKIEIVGASLAAPVTVAIYDLRGNIVANCYPSVVGQMVIWQPDKSVSSGIYFVRATIAQQATSMVCTKRIVYLK